MMAEHEFEIRFRPSTSPSSMGSGLTVDAVQELIDSEGYGSCDDDGLFEEVVTGSFVRPPTELIPVDLSGVNLKYRPEPDLMDEYELGESMECHAHSRKGEPCWGDLFLVSTIICCAGHMGAPRGRPYRTPEEFIRDLRRGGAPYRLQGSLTIPQL